MAILAAAVVAFALIHAAQGQTACTFERYNVQCRVQGQNCGPTQVCGDFINTVCDAFPPNNGTCVQKSNVDDVYAEPCVTTHDCISYADTGFMEGLVCEKAATTTQCLASKGYVMDGCTVDAECLSNQCQNGLCSGLPQGASCQSGQCGLGFFCSRAQNNTCQPVSKEGEPCDPSEVYPCEARTMCGNNICTAIYSLEDGETTQNNGDILCYDGKSVLFGSGYICRPPVNPEQFDYCDPEDDDEGYFCECTSSNVYRLRAVRQAQTFGPDKALYTCVHESGCHPGSNPFAFGACAHYSCYFEMVESLCASLVTPTDVYTTFSNDPTCLRQWHNEYEATMDECRQTMKNKCYKVPGMNTQDCPTPISPLPHPSAHPSPGPSGNPDDGGIGAGGVVAIVITLLVVGGAGGWVFYRRRNGLGIIPDRFKRRAGFYRHTASGLPRPSTSYGAA